MASESAIPLEEQIIHLMLHSREAVELFAESPNKIKHFHPQHQLLLEAILEAEARNASLTRVGFQSFLEKRGIGKMETIANLGTFSKLKITVTGVKLDDMAVILDKKRANYIDEKSIELIEEFRKARSRDPVAASIDLAEKLKTTQDEVEQGNNVTFNDIASDEFFNAWKEELHQKRTTDTPLIDCDIPEIDEVMGTGFGEGTLTVICADVGGFKSTLMLNIALNIWKKHDVDVLFVPLEMPKNRVFDKIVSRETRIDFEWLQRPKNTLKDEHVAKIDTFKAKMASKKGKFVLMEFGERTTVSAIKRQIIKHLNYHKPKVVVIDYIANLNADQNRYGRNDLEIGDMLKELRIMGTKGALLEDGFAVITGAQLGRDALKRLKNQRDQNKLALGSEDIQGSHQYSADATSIFGLMKDPANRGEISIFPIKNRFGRTTYKTGSNREKLIVEPEYSNIKSTREKASWESDADNGILSKSVTVPVMMNDPLEAGWDAVASEEKPKPKPRAKTAEEILEG